MALQVEVLLTALLLAGGGLFRRLHIFAGVHGSNATVGGDEHDTVVLHNGRPFVVGVVELIEDGADVNHSHAPKLSEEGALS